MVTATVDLASDVYGEGAARKLVIMHGLLGAARNWMAIAKRLGGAFEVHALDLRNHGRSPWADGMHYRTMAADVARYMEAKGLAGATVIGHSMGGKASMALALDAPEIVGKLLVADIAPVRYGRVGRTSFLDYLDAMAEIDISGIERRSEADKLLAPAIEDKAVRGFLLQNLTPDEAGGFRWRCNIQGLVNGMADILDFPKELDGQTYGGPTLFLTGDQSDYVRREHRDRIRGLFPKARFAALKDAGHWLHADQPRAFMAAVNTFAG